MAPEGKAPTRIPAAAGDTLWGAASPDVSRRASWGETSPKATSPDVRGWGHNGACGEPKSPHPATYGASSPTARSPLCIQLCIKGCGFVAAGGKDRRGQPYTTCCRGCALDLGHDDTCLRACAPPVATGCARTNGHASPCSSAGKKPIASTTASTECFASTVVSTECVASSVVSTELTPLCKRGCGKPCAAGMDRRGRPFTTCCQGCARNGVHDRYCGLTESEAVALKLQRRQYKYTRKWKKVKEIFIVVSDPLWGVIEFNHIRDGASISRRQHLAWLGFMTCPCLMVTCGLCRNEIHSGLSAAEVRRAWKRLLVSGSMLFSSIQVLLLIASLILYGGFTQLSDNWMLGPILIVFDDMGAKNAARILERGEWWRLFTPMLLHAGVFHLLGNLLVQMRTGLVLECCWGSSAWFLVYITSGFYGCLASCIFKPNVLSVGSSGALCGLLGAWVPFILITWNQTLPNDVNTRNAQLALVVATLVLMVPLSFLPMVDYSAHIGGMLMGAAVSTAIFAGRMQARSWQIATRIAGLLSVCILLLFSMWWFVTFIETEAWLLDVCGAFQSSHPKLHCDAIMSNFE